MDADFFSELVSRLKSAHPGDRAKIKLKLCKKYGMRRIPTDIEVMLNSPRNDLGMVTKPTRTISGVAVIALMSAPIPCPHGKCVYCPGGPGSVFGNTPQSYTGKEPSTMRAIRAGYDPYLMVFNRLEQYAAAGHNFEKVEIIVQGGTFPSFENEYQERFIGLSFKALNDFSSFFFRGNVLDFERFKSFFDLPGSVKDPDRVKRVQSKVLEMKGQSSCSLELEQERNEKSRARCVGLCVETKPDFSRREHIDGMLRLGTTRVELGVQTVYDDVLLRVNRNHTMADTLDACQLLKDSFLKVGFHLMPGLPGSDRERDIGMFREVFENPGLRPDNLKIYPCMVMPGTPLFEDWKAGLFKPTGTAEAAEIIAEGKGFVPEYCRVMRVQRDIPSFAVAAGVDRTNLRQYVEKRVSEKRISCRCIRCREPRGRNVDIEAARMKKRVYDSSSGTEVFISAESGDVLLGFCRLRIPFRPFRREITPDSAGIRELHVFGRAAGLSMEGSVQHKGIGKALVADAERIASGEFGKRKMLVISGIGAKEYYRKLGYINDGTYMSKGVP
ncbi:tRNA uridine(34) 5-carboxymethylaminomethyl modification radical SAM/GNAT enzyme Elp3 [Candidatus Woesearchaeota archaeon]|nr:tRNA uridine(34) 5-carboxymethylaminomethyl modification radical SAM/GNAT enzyme Elp3 [Candidatus Woesearchaeota archaeon]